MKFEKLEDCERAWDVMVTKKFPILRSCMHTDIHGHSLDPLVQISGRISVCVLWFWKRNWDGSGVPLPTVRSASIARNLWTNLSLCSIEDTFAHPMGGRNRLSGLLAITMRVRNTVCVHAHVGTEREREIGLSK